MRTGLEGAEARSSDQQGHLAGTALRMVAGLLATPMNVFVIQGCESPTGP
jgi:hypothetical protein